MLSPIIKELDKRKVIICNINPIQNHKQNELVDFFIKNGFRYFNSLPLDKTKIIIFLFLKTLIFLPCFIQFKFRYLFKKFNFEYSFTSKIKIKNFLKKNKIKSITYVEDAPEIYISSIYEVAKKLKITVLKIPSGLFPGTNNYKLNFKSNKLKYCDKLILPNRLIKSSVKKLNHKLLYFGSLRYSFEWFKFTKKIFLKENIKKKKIVLGFFKKYQSKENILIERLIIKLNQTKKCKIISKEKPRDVFANKCNMYDNDKFSSSELINYSDVIVSSRPSSILVEGLLKKKKIILLVYANKLIKKTLYFSSKAFKLIKSDSDFQKIIDIKQPQNYKKNRTQFLNKSLIDWKDHNKLRRKFIDLYRSI